MNRRTFLNRAAVVASAPLLQRSTIEAASSQIKHVVLVMMENRSFDHIFGWLPNANGIQAGLSYVNQTGQTEATYPSAPDFTGCAYPDPDHSYDGGRTEYDSGKMDGFLQPSSNGKNAIGYYVEQDLPFRAAFARNYTTCDAYFPSIMAPTYPNRIFQYAAQTDRLDDSLTLCTLPTIFDSLKNAGVSHRYYFGNVPFVALWGLKYLDISRSHQDFLTDCALGTLPAVTFLDPSFTLLDNLATDDHPQSDVRNGDAFLSQMFNAVSKSPNWQNTVFIVNYDEWGGFFDHVVPPRAAAPNNVDTDIVNGQTLLGIRVPCVVASPWSLGNPQNPAINSTVFDHTSVLKLIESVWGLAPLTARDASTDVGNLLSVLNLNNPQPAVPSLPLLGYVEPSSLCLSTTNPSGGTNFGDDESGAFIQMVNSGMLKGFPGY
jgi:phospholipase C